MKKHLFNLSSDKRYSLIRISLVFMIFLFSSHTTQSLSPIEPLVYEVRPNISIKTDKIKDEVLFVFEQTLIENGFKITRHRVSGKNRYLYKITLRFKNNYIYDGELILFCEIESDNYVLERVLFESSDLEIHQLGEEIISNLIINPFKEKVSE